MKTDVIIELEEKLSQLEQTIFKYKLSKAPKISTRWVVKDNNYSPDFGVYNAYTVIAVTNTERLNINNEPQVVYKGDNGTVWSLPVGEWPGNLREETNEEIERYNKKTI